MGQPSVLFDLDGTLIDSAPDIHAGANRVLAENGLAPQSLAQVRSFIGSGVSVLIERLLRAAGEAPNGPLHAPMAASFAAGYEGSVGLTQCYPGVMRALQSLADQGYAMGICTNKPVAPTHAVLRHLGLDPFFSCVIGGDSLAVRKPDPAPLWAAVAALGTPDQVVFVGDSEVDAETAHRAGLPFLLYTEGYRNTPADQLPHAARFSDWADLPGLVAAQFPTSEGAS